jgi:hypothetical protein
MLNPSPHAGMPPLEAAPALSAHEFLHPGLFYLPVWGYALWLALRHRGLRLPLLANPRLPAGGLVGESKAAVLDLVEPAAAAWFAPYVAVDRSTDPPDIAAVRALSLARARGLDFPLVAKPDLGCRGAGVRPVASIAALAAYLAAFPTNERLLLQTLVDWEGEAGLFYVRLPHEPAGRLLSLTLKYFPHVVGNGQATLEALIRADPRAGRLAHLYLPRHAGRLVEVLPEGQAFRLAFAGSHSRGALFRDGTRFITPAMEARFEAIARAIPEFHFGRFDVRFATIEALRRGEDFRIVEVNGAGAEATHIWDSRMPLADAYRSLFRQWRLAFQAGAGNRARGFRPEPMGDFVARWRRERRLIPTYPPTA